jgi:uncharacterized protein YjbI with pentapeptide repeats
LTGAIVALGLLPAQIGLQLELRRYDAQNAARSRQQDAETASAQQRQAARADLLTSLNLRTDLRDIDLHDADLRKLYLARRNFAGADFRGAHLNGATLAGANLRGADLAGAHLQGANLTDANLDGATLNYADIRRAVLQGASLMGTKIQWARFDNADFTGAKLSPDSTFDSYASFRGAILAQLDQPNLHLPDDWFDHATFYHDSFLGGDFANSSFAGAEFADTLIVAGSLCGSVLTRAMFVNSSLLATNMVRTDFGHAVASPDSVFAAADLRDSNFGGFAFADHISRAGTLPVNDDVHGYSAGAAFYRSAYDQRTRGFAVVHNRGGQRWTIATGDLLYCNYLAPAGHSIAAVPKLKGLTTGGLTISETVSGTTTETTDENLHALSPKRAIAYAVMLPCIDWSRPEAEACWTVVRRLLPGHPRVLRVKAGGGRETFTDSNEIDNVQAAPPIVGTPPP